MASFLESTPLQQDRLDNLIDEIKYLRDYRSNDDIINVINNELINSNANLPTALRIIHCLESYIPCELWLCNSLLPKRCLIRIALQSNAQFKDELGHTFDESESDYEQKRNNKFFNTKNILNGQFDEHFRIFFLNKRSECNERVSYSDFSSPWEKEIDLYVLEYSKAVRGRIKNIAMRILEF